MNDRLRICPARLAFGPGQGMLFARIGMQEYRKILAHLTVPQIEHL